MISKLTLSARIDQKLFNAVYSRSLVYNTCWEDPAVDRRALELSPNDTVLAISSAGCNVLDYALTGPRKIYAVDANPRQTALLELKMAGIRELDHAAFFQLFGRGQHRDFSPLYRDLLRARLSPFAQTYWDVRTHWFSDAHGGFYFRGLAGTVARVFRAYLKVRPRLTTLIDDLFATRSIHTQRALYEHEIAPLLWTFLLNWTLSRQVTLSMLGVPHPQRREVVAQHPRGVAGFIRESLEYLVRHIPFWSNYFYAVYVLGSYSEECCPEYLKPKQFAALKAGLVDRIVPEASTVTEFLQRCPEPISRFVLLDHMDWMSFYYPEALREEWEAILMHATLDARIIFRSAHAEPRYLERLRLGSTHRPLSDLLKFDVARARELTLADRVHTYAGFHIADLAA
ncbi:MAG: BtaA family protein [Gammaproteobacteria bacterium]|nr:BtaA family protein [Gammaproteobacteria bacterium]